MLNMYIKIAQVIKSCETIPQLKSAKKYLNLWFNGLGGLEERAENYSKYISLKNEINRRINNA